MTVLLEKAPPTALLPGHLQQAELATSDVDSTLEAADDRFYDLQDQPDFAHALAESRIDINDASVHGNPAYWLCFANYTRRACQIEGRNPNADDSQLIATELFAEAPIFGHYEQLLQGTKSLPGSKFNEALDFVIGYNSHLLEFAGKHLDVPRKELASQIRDHASVLEKIPNFGKGDVIGGAVRGVQHEVGFEQLLQGAGIEFMRGSNEDDGEGVDYWILHADKEIPVDVKASLHEVLQVSNGPVNRQYVASGSEALPDKSDETVEEYANQPYVIKGGRAIVYSLLTDSDFKDGTFRLSPEVAAKRAEYLVKMVNDLSNELG
jgi:hypothetical protein